jgi:hypothetical protein
MSEPQPSREIDLDEEDLELREEDEEVDGEEQTPGTEPDAKKAKSKGRKKSWIHSYMHREAGFVVCDVKVSKLVDQKWEMIECGKKYQ